MNDREIVSFKPNEIFGTYILENGVMMIYNNATYSSHINVTSIQFNYEYGSYFFDVNFSNEHNWVIKDIYGHSEFVFLGKDITVKPKFRIKNYFRLSEYLFRFEMNVDRDLTKTPLYTIETDKYGV